MGKITPTREHVSTPPPAAIPAAASADRRPKNVDAHPTATNDTTSSSPHSETEPIRTTPTSRKQKRKQRKHAALPPTPPSSDTEPPTKRTPPNNPPRTTAPPSIPPTPTMAKPALQKTYPLLICSLGNPGSAYAHTLHSVGHTITSHISAVKSYTPFAPGLAGRVARPDNTTYSFGPLQGFRKTNEKGVSEGEDDWTLWQSTSLMNVSGKGVARAWREFSAEVARSGRGQGRLVVVHDELESALGKVSVRDGANSAKGHNGIKSVQASLGGTKWWRVGVGIGRPESREPNVVAGYVLRKMHAGEMRAMEKACAGVVAVLREIAEGKR
ncbi:peptidyl-tRNA hydrolase [Karstenula rhodostoma CBS 690.94]|uniref:peptidyl-tRNA hydrolase n=1 Tax=Karstenula rhodostoma CBS 690.94 TaxID=1392251 RepID=A0A9P4UEV6_9PLEO|nr:peptidyl-tRNA hydrolase [Karstenula rhodostoma CBS 690.94]